MDDLHSKISELETEKEKLEKEKQSLEKELVDNEEVAEKNQAGLIMQINALKQEVKEKDEKIANFEQKSNIEIPPK
jgi:hypothetical protein